MTVTGRFQNVQQTQEQRSSPGYRERENRQFWPASTVCCFFLQHLQHTGASFWTDSVAMDPGPFSYMTATSGLRTGVMKAVVKRACMLAPVEPRCPKWSSSLKGTAWESGSQNKSTRKSKMVHAVIFGELGWTQNGTRELWI